MAKELERQQPVRLVDAALLTKQARMQEVSLSPDIFASQFSKFLSKVAKDDSIVVHSDKDRMTDVDVVDTAAQEYILLKKMQDYIDFRIGEIKQTFFSTLDENPPELDENSPEWMHSAPTQYLPGEISSENAGLKFQRTQSRVTKSIDESLLKKERPRIYASMMKDVEIPAVEARTVKVFDEEAFEDRCKKDPSFKKYIKTTYKNPQFRTYNVFDEE